MKLRNVLYKQHYRSHNHSQTRDHTEYHERQYRKQLEAIEVSLSMMNTAFKNNIKIQQIYLDLVKARTHKLNFKQKDIRNVYKILSENKTGQIIFTQAYQKDIKQRKDNSFMNNTTREQAAFMTSSLNSSRFKELATTLGPKGSFQHLNRQKSPSSGSKVNFKQTLRDSLQTQDQKTKNTEGQNGNKNINSYVNQYLTTLMVTYRRLYSRLVQAKIKKLTYYILNKQYLQKVILHTISELSKRLQTLIRRIFDFRDFKFLFQVIKLIYEENFIIQQKIYELLVNENHVVSLEQFFRINGIMMEDNQIARRRSSRMSAISVKRLSNLNNQPICLDQLKIDSKPKESRFNPKKNTQCKKKEKHHFIQKQNINIQHVDKINKEIECKYAAALDRIGDLIEKGNQDLAFFQHKNNQSTKNFDDQLSMSKQSQPSQEPALENIYRSKSKKKSLSLKKRYSIFQYFSSSFKQIIKQLDHKKGKTSQFMIESHQDSKVQNILKDNFNIPQSTQIQKINNETISLQNPSNVARLLNKKFKSFLPHSINQKNINSMMNKKVSKTNSSKRHDPINNLLKIYENKNKQSHIIDILFGTNFEDQDQKSLQKNFIKLSVMAKLKQKKIDQIKGNQIDCAKFQDYMKKEIEQEYEQLMTTRKNNKIKKTLGAGFNLYHKLDTGPNDCSQQKSMSKKRKNINLDKTHEGVNIKENKTFLNTEIQKDQPKQFLFQLKSPFGKQTNRKLAQVQSRCGTVRKHHQSNPSQTKMQLASHLNTFQCFQRNELNKFQAIYAEFTNPLTKCTGYYKNDEYKSLRNSLEKREIRSIVKLKQKFQNKNLLEIGQRFSIWNAVRKERQKGKDKTKETINQSNIIKEIIIDTNYALPKQQDQSKNFKIKELNIFQHQLLNNFAKWQKQNHPDGEEIVRFSKIKPSQPIQLKILRLKCSKTQRRSLKQLTCSQNKKQIKEVHSKKILERMSSGQMNTLDRDFCLNTKRIEKPNLELNQDELDGFIQNYLRANKIIEENKLNYTNHNDSFVIKDMPKVISSSPVSPRHSFKRIKQLYSTHRRAKIE